MIRCPPLGALLTGWKASQHRGPNKFLIGYFDMQIGDRVTKRGSEGVGTIVDIGGVWVSIKWDDGALPRERPRMCHVAELEKSTEQE
jgi:hypothetical protein